MKIKNVYSKIKTKFKGFKESYNNWKNDNFNPKIKELYNRLNEINPKRKKVYDEVRDMIAPLVERKKVYDEVRDMIAPLVERKKVYEKIKQDLYQLKPLFILKQYLNNNEENKELYDKIVNNKILSYDERIYLDELVQGISMDLAEQGANKEDLSNLFKYSNNIIKDNEVKENKEFLDYFVNLTKTIMSNSFELDGNLENNKGMGILYHSKMLLENLVKYAPKDIKNNFKNMLERTNNYIEIIENNIDDVDYNYSLLGNYLIEFSTPKEFNLVDKAEDIKGNALFDDFKIVYEELMKNELLIKKLKNKEMIFKDFYSNEEFFNIFSNWGIDGILNEVPKFRQKLENYNINLNDYKGISNSMSEFKELREQAKEIIEENNILPQSLKFAMNELIKAKKDGVMVSAGNPEKLKEIILNGYDL